MGDTVTNDNEGKKARGGLFARAPKPADGDKTGEGNDKARPKTKGDQRRRLSVICGVCVGVTVISLGLSGAMLASANGLRAKLAENTVNVVTATEDVKAGETIDVSKLQVAAVPKAFAPADAVSPAGDDAAAIEEAKAKVGGRRALANITAGNPISGSIISNPDSPTALAQVPAEGNVAYMVSIDTANGLAPFLRVGDKVDVYSGSDQVAPRKLFEAVRVIALDGALTGGGTNAYSTVTLELTDAQALQLFQEADVSGSTLHLALTPERTLQEADASAQAAGQAGSASTVASGQNAATDVEPATTVAAQTQGM